MLVSSCPPGFSRTDPDTTEPCGLKLKNSKSNVTPEQILEEHSPLIRELANQLRALILKTVPGLNEVAYPGWHAIGYRHPEAGYLCGLFPYDDHIKVYFGYGRFLFDPDKLLTGDGKQTRYLQIENTKDIRVKSIANLLMESIDFRTNKMNSK